MNTYLVIQCTPKALFLTKNRMSVPSVLQFYRAVFLFYLSKNSAEIKTQKMCVSHKVYTYIIQKYLTLYSLYLLHHNNLSNSIKVFFCFFDILKRNSQGSQRGELAKLSSIVLQLHHLQHLTQ